MTDQKRVKPNINIDVSIKATTSSMGLS